MTAFSKASLAHISDLHLGDDPLRKLVCQEIIHELIKLAPDFVAVTGDVTEHGTFQEVKLFMSMFASLFGRLLVVPGNHDRGGQAAGLLMRESCIERDLGALRVFMIDTSHPSNGIAGFVANGLLPDAASEVARLTLDVPRNQLPVLLLHHHLRPLPVEDMPEVLSETFGLPFTNALAGGQGLLNVLADRTLVLHGHKHRPGKTVGVGPVCYNAGSTTELGAFRVFEVAEGRLQSERWIHTKFSKGVVS